MPRTLTPRRPARTDKRSVYVLIRHQEEAGAPIPAHLGDHRWTPWGNCSPDDIASGLLAGMAARRRFRDMGGPALFAGEEPLEHLVLDVLVFDPARHKKRAGRILDVHCTTYKFSPR